MMAMTAKIDGMEEISEMLTRLEEDAPKAAAAGLYDGAGVMADELEKGVESIKTAPFKYTKFGQRLPSPEEKEAIRGAIGVAKFEKNGTEVNTSVGFGNSGYADVAGKQKAVAQIANAINSGTSFMAKQPFFRRAANAGAKKAEAAIKQAIEQRVSALDK